MDFSCTKVLIATNDDKLSSTITAVLPIPLFETSICKDFNEVRRKISESYYEIIIIDSGDGSQAELAVDISETASTVLLLAPTHLFDQISYKVEPFGILTITKPFDAFYFYNMIKIALAVQAKIKRISSQTVKLKEKMEEIRLINRAKMLLMQNSRMTEQEAHRYIEKDSMDRCIKRTEVAKEIIAKFDY